LGKKEAGQARLCMLRNKLVDSVRQVQPNAGAVAFLGNQLEPRAELGGALPHATQAVAVARHIIGGKAAAAHAR